MIEVVRPGPLTTVQDLGRPGWAHLGVSGSGAADRGALRLANRLVGNPEGLAGLETTFSGPELRFAAAATVVLTGAPAPAWVDGIELAPNAATDLPAGVVLRVGTAPVGLRTYLAVAGGLAVEPTLGSASTDTLGGLGPAPLRAGDELQVGPVRDRPPPLDALPVAAPTDQVELAVALGPRDDWFTQAARRALLRTRFTVSGDCDRTGVRLTGATLERRDARELRSEGMVTGAIQVPPSGDPIILLADHPTTGGYPVIAVVRRRAVDLVAQLRPGSTVTFVASRS